MVAAGLRDRRRTLAAAWERYQGRGAVDGVRHEVAASWDRSVRRLGAPVDGAPVDSDEQVRAAWQASPVRLAVAAVADDVERTAVDCDLVAAVTDATGRILWTAGGAYMRDRASAVNFVPGGRWDEASVGTNALDLALRTGRPANVFSAEHFSPCVHGWVCYAAPLTDPRTGEVLGVLDLSTTWDRSHPMAVAAVTAFARTASQALAQLQSTAAGRRDSAGSVLAGPEGAASLQVLGRPRLQQGGTPIMITLRQAEILLALALHPTGLTLDQLQAHVYGDMAVSSTTVKAEVSRLRRTLPGAIESRPYRVTMPVLVDALDILAMVAAGDARAAAESYVDDVLPASEAPAARELAVRLEVAVRTLVLRRMDVSAAVRLAERRPYDLEVLEHALRLLPAASPHRALLEGELAATLRD